MLRDEEEAFRRLNEYLKEEEIHLKVICAGGFVLYRHGIRGTQDIDAFYASSEKITKAIKRVGDEMGLNSAEEFWMNNSIQNLNETPPEQICETVYRFSNLTVAIPPILYVAGMKLISARGQDIRDVASILKKEKIEDPQVLRSALENYGFSSIDESVLLESFGLAYGFNWLEAYYREHESEILQRL